MFRDLENISFDDFEFLMMDEIGEKIFGANLENDYNSNLLANHIINFLNIIKYDKKLAEIEFANVKIIVYWIDEYKIFFISKNSFTVDQKLRISDIVEKIKNILEV